MATSKRRKPQADETPQYSPEELLKYYREMLLIRRFEEKAGQMYGMGLIGGFCHLYIGQEAVVVGMQNALIPGDSVITSYRDHGHMLATDMDPKGVMAELTGRRGGYSQGQGRLDAHVQPREEILRRPWHRRGSGADRHRPRLRAQVPQDGNINVSYFGDGAINQGQVYESFNMAALWKLPVVYVIENNKYAMGTSQHRASAGELCERGSAYGIPGHVVDGMDVLAVKEASEEAVDPCPRGQWPGHPRDEDLPLPRPFHVRPGEVPHQGRSHQDADGDGPDRQPQEVMLENGSTDEDALKTIDDRGIATRSSTEAGRHSLRTARSLTNISLSSCDAIMRPLPRRPRLGIGAGGTGMPIDSDAGVVADDDRGQARQVVSSRKATT